MSSTATVATANKESFGKRSGSFGGLVKRAFRSGNSKREKKQSAQKVTVHIVELSEPVPNEDKLVKVDTTTAAAATAPLVPAVNVEDLLSAESAEEEDQQISTCPSDADAANAPQILNQEEQQEQEQPATTGESGYMVDISYTSDNASLLPVAVVPVDISMEYSTFAAAVSPTTDKHGSIGTVSTADSVSSAGEGPSRSPPRASSKTASSPASASMMSQSVSVTLQEGEEEEEEVTVGEETAENSAYYQGLLLRSQESEWEDESISLVTLETMNTSQEMTFEYVVRSLGKMVERQLNAVEKNIACQQSVRMDDIKEEENEDQKHEDHEIAVEGTDYVAADQEKNLSTRGRSMDSKIMSGVTTPSAGTRIISNTPRRKRQQQEVQNETDDMDDSLASFVSDEDDGENEEDEIVRSRQRESELARSISRVNQRMQETAQRDSILDILQDLASNNEEGSEQRSLISGSVAGTVSILGNDVFSQQTNDWDVFECVHRRSEELCTGKEANFEASEGGPNMSTYDVSDVHSLSPTPPRKTGNLLPIPEILPQNSAVSHVSAGSEVSQESPMEQTVESHGLVVGTMKHSRSDVANLIKASQDKEALLESFRDEFPDLYKSMVKQLGLTSEQPAMGSTQTESKEKSRNGPPSPFLRGKSLFLRGNQSTGQATAKTTNKSDETKSSKSNNQTEPSNKRRSLFGVLTRAASKKPQSSVKTKQDATGKENVVLKKSNQLHNQNAAEKDAPTKVAKIEQKRARKKAQASSKAQDDKEAQLAGKSVKMAESTPPSTPTTPPSPPRVVKKTTLPQFEPAAEISKEITPQVGESAAVSDPGPVQTVVEKFHATPSTSLTKSQSIPSGNKPALNKINRVQSASAVQASFPGRINRVQSAPAIKAASAASKRAKKANLPAEPNETKLKKTSSLMQFSKSRKTEVPDAPRRGDERPLRDSPSKASSSDPSVKSSSRSRRKVSFSRTPLILQRLHSSRSSMVPKSDESLEEGISFLLENEQGVSLKTSSWLDDDVALPAYISPPVQSKDVLMTKHTIPKNPTAPSPVPQLYGAGDKEFEEFGERDAC